MLSKVNSNQLACSSSTSKAFCKDSVAQSKVPSVTRKPSDTTFRKPVVLSSSLRKPKKEVNESAKNFPKSKQKRTLEETVRQIDIRPIPLKLTHVRGGSLPLRSTYILVSYHYSKLNFSWF